MMDAAALEGLSLPSRSRDLGAAYRARDVVGYATAREFLYPQSLQAKRHFSWAISVSCGMDEGWMRGELDRMRPAWDRERNALLACTEERMYSTIGRKRELERRRKRMEAYQARADQRDIAAEVYKS
jgi:hypothetical protein